jgi:carbonic anhydrase
MWVHTKESQEKISPEQALTYLKEGNERFLNNLKQDRDHLMQVNQTSEGQFPFAAILSCIDSRTSAELIFDQGLGDIFSVRIAGNVINEDILGSLEYACAIANSKIVVVLGHTKCGAIISACDGVETGHLTGLLQKIKPAIARETYTQFDRTGQNVRFVTNVCIQHVRIVMDQILEQSNILRKLVEENRMLIVGGLYDVDTGAVTFLGE